MSDKRSEDIALFRYRLIAPVLNDTGIRQMQYFRQMSQKEYEVPHLGKTRYKPGAFKKWLWNYKNGGFDGLKPKIRTDRGRSRKIDEHLGQIIKEKFREFPFLSCAAVYRLLISEGQIDTVVISEGTLRKYIKDNNLKVDSLPPVPRKRFEKEHINELWIADCMHGPYILYEKKKRPVFLISAIDDSSRVIVGSRFFFHENSINLEIILKEAVSRFGLPQAIYTDNGSIFVSSHLQLACARLGIALIHSKPYDSPSRGKIERFHRTVRQKFLTILDTTGIESLEALNASYTHWLMKEYQKGFHHGIGTTPINKWMDQLRVTPLKRVTAHELDLAFYITIKRRVKNDATVSVNGILYEVPHRFIGNTIELRYPADKPKELSIFEADKPVAVLKRLDTHENARTPAWEIRFSPKEKRP